MSIEKLKTKYANGAWLPNMKSFFEKTNEVIEAINNNPASVAPYKEYIAHLLTSANAASAPTVTVMINTFDSLPEWSYVSEGTYVATLPNAFTVGKTIVIAPNPANTIAQGGNYYSAGTDDVNTVYLITGAIDSATGVLTATNNGLYGVGYTTITIRVYE